MPGPLPLLKLGFLLVKQVSKPFAKFIAAKAKNSKVFRDWVCMPIANGVNKMEVRMKFRAMNLGQGKVTKVPKLSEAKAVEQGSEILSEFIILSIASGILTWEYWKSSEKDKAKEEKLKADREMIKQKIYELEMTVEKQNSQIRSLTKTAIHLEEETRAMTLKGMKRRLLGGEVEVPQELRDTLAEIPEQPREVKPMKMVDDEDKTVSDSQDKTQSSDTASSSSLNQLPVQSVHNTIEPKKGS